MIVKRSPCYHQAPKLERRFDLKTGQKKIAAAAAILWLILATSPVQITNGAAFAEENLRNSLEDISISNFSRVTPDIWRGSNPDDDELEKIVVFVVHDMC